MDPDEAMKRFRETYNMPAGADDDNDVQDFPQSRDSHRPIGGRYGADNKPSEALGGTSIVLTYLHM